MTMRPQDSSVWPVIYGLVVLVVAGLFLYSIGDVLTPVVLFLALLLLLSPYTGTREYVLALTTAALLLLIWVLRTTGFLVAPFILALVGAYILDPAVDALERRRVPRSAAILLLVLPVAPLIAAALVFGIPAFTAQVESLIGEAPRFLDRAVGWLERMTRLVAALDLPFVDEQAVQERLSAPAPAEVVAFLDAQREVIARRTWRAVLGLGQGIGAVLTIVGYLVLTPVLTFYLLRDYDALIDRMVGLVPEGRRARWVAFAREFNVLLARYLRGQVIAAAAVGVLTALGLWLTGFPFSGLVGAVAGVFNLVPYLGLIVSLVPAVIIAFLTGNVLLSLLKIAAVFLAVQLIDSTILGPRIVGGSVGLHPAWVMLALALGGFFFGFVGLLLAVPLAILAKLLLRAGLERYHASGVYRGEGSRE